MMETDNDGTIIHKRHRSASLPRDESGVENISLSTESSAQYKATDIDRLTAPLPLWELVVYFVVWSGAIAYACYDVFQASAKHVKTLARYYDFEDGWTFLHRKRDTTNFEWEFYRGWFIQIWPWFAGHLLIGQLCRRINFEARLYVFPLYCMVAVSNILGPKSVGLILVHCFIMYVSSLSRLKMVVWAASLTLLTTITFEEKFRWITEFFIVNDSSQLRYYLQNFSLAMINIRLTSVCVEMADQRRRYAKTPVEPGERRLKYMLFDLVSYIFYLPLLFTGPLMTFDEFYKQINAPMLPWTSHRIRYIIKEVFRIGFWCIFIEFVLYFFYFNAMKHDPNYMENMSLGTLTSIGWMILQFFMLKYIPLFGLPRIFAHMDQLDPPDGPKCPSRTHQFTFLWRTFDRGLHNFIKRHIYIALGGSHNGVLVQTFASFCCFAYVAYWHGAEEFLFMWTGINFLGVMCEIAGPKFMKRTGVKEFEEKYLSPAMGRRLRAMAIAPITIFGFSSTLLFLSGKNIGYIFAKRLLLDPLPALKLVILFYCCAQTSIAAAMNETDTPLLWPPVEEPPLKYEILEEQAKEPSVGEPRGQGIPRKSSSSKLSIPSKRSSRTNSRRKQ